MNAKTTKKFKPVIRYFDMAILTNNLIDGTLQISILTPKSKVFPKGYDGLADSSGRNFMLKIRDGGDGNLDLLVHESVHVTTAVMERIQLLAETFCLEKELAQSCLVFSYRAANLEEAKKIVEDIQKKYDKDVAFQKLLSICSHEEVKAYLTQAIFYAAKLVLDEYNRVNGINTTSEEAA